MQLKNHLPCRMKCETFNTQCPVCPLSLPLGSLIWVLSCRVWWHVLVFHRFHSCCVCLVSLAVFWVLEEFLCVPHEAWPHLLVHKLSFGCRIENFNPPKTQARVFIYEHANQVTNEFSYFLWYKMFLASLFHLEFFSQLRIKPPYAS